MDVCQWLLRDAAATVIYETIICADGGLVGPAIPTDVGERWYLFDDAGIAALVDRDDAGLHCVGGTSALGHCIGDLVGHACRVLDAATE